MRLRIAIALLVITALGTSLLAQQPPQAERAITVRAVGGYLGLIEGFPELPGGAYDVEGGWTPGTLRDLGGSLGLRRWLDSAAATRGPGEQWLLLAPNNQIARFQTDVELTTKPEMPVASQRQDIRAKPEVGRRKDGTPGDFWDDVRRATPDVIALGPEDFYRSLRAYRENGALETQPARSFVRFVRTSGLPFLASNAAIRLKSKHLATNKSGQFELDVDDETSVPWIAPVTVRFPCSHAPVITLVANGKDVPTLVKPSADGQCTGKDKNDTHRDVTVQLTGGGLAPDQEYGIRIDASIALKFRTDQALAGFQFSRLMAPWPMAIGRDSVVISLVDPDTRSGLGERAWRFDGSGPDATQTDCSGDCEIVFLDPVKTAKALVARLKAANKDRMPVIILLSALDDAQTMTVMEAIPEVRMVVLPADSELLGRAALAATATQKDKEIPAFSGDLGFSGILDADKRSIARVMVRPEWFGETVATMTAELSGTGPSWELRPSAAVSHIKGAKLTAEEVEGSAQTRVRYVATLDKESVAVGHYARYRGDASEVWAKPDDLRFAMATAIARKAKAEIGALAGYDIDHDYLRWLKDQRIDRSRFFVERVLFRSQRIVRAYVKGDKLPNLLATVAERDDFSDGSCLAGLGDGCATIDKDHPERIRVNGRRVDPNLVYSIAMSDGLAAALKLEHDDGRVFDAQEGVDEHFAAASSALPKLSGAGSYVRLDPFEFGLDRTTVDDPDSPNDIRGNLPIDQAKAAASRTYSINLGTDIAVLDTRWWAVRFPSKFALAEVRRKELSYDKDEFSVGGRLDFKMPGWGGPRLFAGYFWDGSLKVRRLAFTAQRQISVIDGVKTIETADFATPGEIRPTRYRHLTVGFGIEEQPVRRLPVPLKVKLLSGDFSQGSRSNIVTGARVGTVCAVAVDDLLRVGPGQSINNCFRDNGAAFVTERPSLLFDTDRRPQRRLQGDVAIESTFKLWDHEMTLGFEYQGRRYLEEPDNSPLAIRTTNQFGLTAKWPFWWRFSTAIEYEHDRARIFSNDLFVTRRIQIKLFLPLLFRTGNGKFVL